MILVVDDDPEICLSLERLLRYSGYDVVAVQRPMEALSLLGVRKPKAILLDLNLPLMDGLTLLKAIRTDPGYRQVPVLIFTADFTESNELLARQLNDCALSKRPAEVIALLARDSARDFWREGMPYAGRSWLRPSFTTLGP